MGLKTFFKFNFIIFVVESITDFPPLLAAPAPPVGLYWASSLSSSNFASCEVGRSERENLPGIPDSVTTCAGPHLLGGMSARGISLYSAAVLPGVAAIPTQKFPSSLILHGDLGREGGFKLSKCQDSQ